MMMAFAKTDCGKVRTSNQDGYLLSEGLYAVADGMGGHRGGETASRIALETLEKALKGGQPNFARLLRGLEAANRRVWETGRGNPALEGMGTTLEVLWENGNQLLLGHVGDSRIYRLRSGHLEQLTEDHSMVYEMIKKGLLTPELARTHPYRNVITRALGTDARLEPDLSSEALLPGDRYLLCSDGLHGLVEEETLCRILQDARLPEYAAECLVEAALEAGGTDNVTALVCFSGEVDRAC